MSGLNTDAITKLLVSGINPEVIINSTTEAVIQAYNDYNNIEVVAPEGYMNTGISIYGWEGFTSMVAKKFAVVFRSIHNPRTILIAFRGTSTLDEWIEDAEFPLINFHEAEVARGFLDIYTRDVPKEEPPSLQNSLLNYICDTDKLIITGHSLGGAVADLFAYDVAMKLKINPILITYASPNVGKSSWVDSFNKNVPIAIRVYNTQDIIAYLPPTYIGYLPVGVAWEIKFNPYYLIHRITPTTLVVNHSIHNYKYTTCHAIENDSQDWVGTFQDQSTDTAWDILSEIVEIANTPFRATAIHTDFLEKHNTIHDFY